MKRRCGRRSDSDEEEEEGEDSSFEEAPEYRLGQKIEGDGRDEKLFAQNPDLQGKVEKARRMPYIITVAPAMPDKYPFIIKFDFHGRMLCTVFEDLYCIDIDCGDDKSKKNTALKELEQYAVARRMKFAIWETRNGLHAYCLSHPLAWHSSKTRAEMVEASRQIKCDRWYFAFAAVRGFSQRLSPKGIVKSNKDDPEKSNEDDPEISIASQFVKRRFDGEATGMQIVGADGVTVDSTLEAKVMLVSHLTEFATRLCRKDPERLLDDKHVPALLLTVSQEAEMMWNSLKHAVHLTSCEIRIPQVLWIRSKKPGKQNWWIKTHKNETITVYEINHDGFRMWKIAVVDKSEKKRFPTSKIATPKKAKRVVEVKYGSPVKSLEYPPMSDRQRTRLRFGDVHRFGDKCFACGGYGHWAGDPECTTSEVYHKAQGGWCFNKYA